MITCQNMDGETKMTSKKQESKTVTERYRDIQPELYAKHQICIEENGVERFMQIYEENLENPPWKVEDVHRTLQNTPIVGESFDTFEDFLTELKKHIPENATNIKLSLDDGDFYDALRLTLDMKVPTLVENILTHSFNVFHREVMNTKAKEKREQYKANKKEREKEKRYQEFLKLQKEFGDVK